MRITIECDSVDELNQLATRLGGNTVAVASKASAPKDEPKPSASAKTHEDTGSKAERDGEAKPKEEPKAAPAKIEAAEISYAKDVAPRVLELAGMKLPDAPKAGREAAVTVMKKFGVEKAPQLKVEQYADFIVAIDAAVEAIKAKA